MSLFEPYQVSADAVREAAEQSTAGIEGLRQIRADVDIEHRAAVGAVEGDIRPYVDAAPVASESYTAAMVARLSFARGGAHLFALAIDKFNTDSSDPRSVSKLNAAYEAAAADHFGVDAGEYTKSEGGLPTLDRSRYSGAVTIAKDALIAELRAEYGRLDKQMDADAAEIAAMLRGDDPSDKDVRAMFAAGALPSYAAMLFPDVNLRGTKLSRLPTDLRGLSNEQLAKQLVEEPRTFAVLGKQLKRLVPGIENLVGREIAQQLRDAELEGKDSGAELRRLTAQLRTWQDVSLGVTASIYTNLGAEDSLEFLTKLNRLTDVTGENPLDLADVFRRGILLADDKVWSDEQSMRFGTDLSRELGKIDNWDALAYLLHDQSYSTALLDPIAERIAQLDEPGTVLNTPTPHGSLNGPANVTEALFSALSKNGEAALNFFFPEGVDDDTGELAKRHEWFLATRTIQSADGLEDLLAALNAATTDERNIEDLSRQHLAAGLVSSIAEYLPDNDQVKESLKDGTGTAHLAHILGAYMESINGHLLSNLGEGDRGAETSLRPDGTAVAYFEESEVKDLVKLAVSNEAGFGAMRQGVSAFQNLQLARDMADGSISEATLRDDARLEGFFMNSVGEQEIDVAREKDQRVAAWVDLGNELVGLVPLPGADDIGEAGASALSYLAGQSTALGEGAVTDSFASNTKDAFDEYENASDYAYAARHIAIATQLADPGSDGLKPLISHDELRAQAAGYPPEVVEKWFGTKENPRVPTPADIATMPDRGVGTKDQYLMVMSELLQKNLPVFQTGDYEETYEKDHEDAYKDGSYK